MKTIVSEELRSRISHAAINGSIVAQDILNELRSNRDHSEIIRGSANYLSTKRIKGSNSEYISIKVVFTACTKDITNPNFPDRNNPQAPWFSENRSDIEPSTFVGYFKNLPEYTQKDMDYFISTITLNSKVSVRLYDKMSDIADAYNECNYSPVAQAGETSLHNSCMRKSDKARNAADFYYNFAGAKIIVAKDGSNNVLGRAIVWKNAYTALGDAQINISIVDRVYFSHFFVIDLILQYAESIGIQLRKKVNDYEHAFSFVAINPVEQLGAEKGTSLTSLIVRIKVPAKKWHKQGAPYLDTFGHIHVTDQGALELSNNDGKTTIATCRSTGGTANRERSLCPKCGEIHRDGYDVLCKECHSALFTNTFLGQTMTCKTVKYRNELYPTVLFSKGRPTPSMSLYLQIEKLY